MANFIINSNTNSTPITWEPAPSYVVALLSYLDSELCRTQWNMTQKVYESPFSNSGNYYSNGTFEVEAYSWDDNYEQPYNFKCGELEISWYKYLGRDTRINKHFSPEQIIRYFDICLESIKEEEEEYFKAQGEGEY